jgi:hypothetical protein
MSEQHERNCPAWINRQGDDVNSEDCTCGLRFRRVKQVYVGAPAIFALEQCCQHICDAYDSFGCYLVGSALQRQDWRDIDIRMILSDEDFAREFPNVEGRTWEHDSKWLLTIVSISAWLSKQTGLPVDFQIQPQTHANEVHKGPRSAIGIKISKPSVPPDPAPQPK